METITVIPHVAAPRYELQNIFLKLYLNIFVIMMSFGLAIEPCKICEDVTLGSGYLIWYLLLC